MHIYVCVCMYRYGFAMAAYVERVLLVLVSVSHNTWTAAPSQQLAGH